MYFSFTKAQYLYLTLLVPLLIFLHFFTLRGSKRKALRFANFEAVEKIRGVDLFSRNIVVLLMSIIILLLLVFSLSGMTLHRTMQASSFSFVLAIDTSLSMEASDISPTRLEGSKEIASNFVDSAPVSTKIGVVSFSGNSIIENDLTDDKAEVKNSLSNIEISSVRGTDIYEAVITSSNLLKGEEGKSIVLMSDGQLNIGELQEFIDYSNDHDVIVNTIAIGTEQGGSTTYGVSKVNEDTLKAIAYNTDGEFLRATDRESLEDSFNEIMDLKKRKVSINLTPYFSLALVFIFVLFYFLINTKYKILP